MKGTLLFAAAALVSFNICAFAQMDDPAEKVQKTYFSQTFTIKTGPSSEVQNIVLRGDEIATLNGVLTCHGGCQVVLGNVQLKADEFYFHPETGEAEARYNVRIKVLPATIAKR